MKNFFLSFTILFAVLSAAAQTSTFLFTGAAQYYTVPAGATGIIVDMQGAMGAGNSSGYGGGCRVQATIPVLQGGVLSIYVGGTGDCSNGTGGFNGGGWGSWSFGYNNGCGGGGASDIRLVDTSLSNRIIVASGGGGSAGACGCGPIFGGYGGAITGGNGSNGAQGATQTAGGAGSYYSSCNGGFGYGGSSYGDCGSGGGGGGYYGGSATSGPLVCGGCNGGGGGGGSSFVDSNAVNVIYTAGYNDTGNGIIKITPVFNCFGNVVAGQAVITPDSGASSDTFVLSLVDTPAGNGIVYQWQSASADSGIWSLIPAATNASFLLKGLSESSNFRCMVMCTNDGNAAYTNIVSATLLSTGTPLLYKNAQNITIYPNPTDEKTYINTTEPGTFSLFATDGRLLFSRTITNGITVLQLSGMKPSVYIAEFLGQSGVKIKDRLIISR